MQILDKKLRVLYLISCFGHGRGGHFYSLKTTAMEIGKENDICIVSVGTSHSPVFLGIKDYIPIISKLPDPLVIWKIVKLVNVKKIEFVHSFDNNSYLFARIVSVITGVPVLHTKCGGPSPKRYYPKVRDLVLFSDEDMRYFNQSSKHQQAQLYHIPNRVSVIEPDLAAIQLLKKRLRENAKIILRIARFSEDHKKSILDSIALVKQLRTENIDIQLLLVGAIQDKAVYEEISLHVNNDIVLITDDAFTVNASRIIEIADLVVGTGRGAMEAAVHGKVLLSPVKALTVPVLVNQANIDRFLEYNFSSRVELDAAEGDEYSKIKEILLSERALYENQAFIHEYADKNFAISSVKQKYQLIYKKTRKCQICPIDIFANFFSSMKSYLSSMYPQRNRLI